MKAIVCEMCNGHDVVKQDGFYVCQSCGTKYSTEDAKKLMVEVEGTVDVSGSTVKVDDTDSTDRILQLARRARAEGNTENAAKYYEMVAINRPDDWESGFYSVYYQAANCKIAGITSAANRVSNNIHGTIRLMKEQLSDGAYSQPCEEMITEVSSLAKAMIDSAKNHYKECQHNLSNYTYGSSAYNSALASNNKMAAEGNERVNAALSMLGKLSMEIWGKLRDKNLAIKAADEFLNNGGGKDAYFVLLAGPDPSRAESLKKEHVKMQNYLNEQARKSGYSTGVTWLVFGIIALIIGLVIKLPKDISRGGLFIVAGTIKFTGIICGILFPIMGLLKMKNNSKN